MYAGVNRQMTDETKIVLVLGGISILLCCWAYYHCLMRQREKYDNLKKAFAEDFPNSWGANYEKAFAKPAKRPRLYKQATVVTKGELPIKRKPATKKPVAKKTTVKPKAKAKK